ncbi:PDDEXK nuclease domain-containing protein [Georgenia daeguensis]|uniref:PDDEXK nuclease domain-containing protein n=1 Tax=Georgenia daeguensis TaxID=908355 RepID=UPI003CD06995
MRYGVVELKIGRFSPAYVGQLGTCVAVVDDRVRDHAIHAPPSGCCCAPAETSRWFRYALASASAPLAVATYDTLIPKQRQDLPDLERLTAALTDVLADTSRELSGDKPTGIQRSDPQRNSDLPSRCYSIRCPRTGIGPPESSVPMPRCCPYEEEWSRAPHT